ncbi:MAG: alanine racemase [Gammaproteobacteria bacterium]|nr:alanine racemase [Gammaproteobacteria bacterium]
MTAPRAYIDPRALAHNVGRVRELAPTSDVMAVIKADGYGHGLLDVADALGAANGFAVARLDEALRLRAHGVDSRIKVLRGWASRGEVDEFVQHQLDAVVHDRSQLSMLAQSQKTLSADVWLKVETGMHRLGLAPRELDGAVAQLKAQCAHGISVRLMTHLASSDVPGDADTQRQIQRALALRDEWALPISIANSGAVLRWPSARADWVRPGIMLYGVSPFENETGAALGLRPVMHLEATLIAAKSIEAGARVGYAGSWIARERMRMGVVSIGYGDGYPRHMPAGTPTVIRGQTAPLIGRVSMDMINVDLSGVPNAQVGDAVTLWGEGLPVERVAASAGTIAYELVTRVMPRVVRQLR